jgi:tetratricopeptide (TPR) repeat protein
MAQGYYNLGEPHMAVNVWAEGVVNMPTSSEGFFNLGLLQRELGGASAERCYKTAVRLLPTSARYRYSYGNLLYDRQRLVGAASVYAAALRLDPMHLDALNNLGNALRQLGQLDRAKATFEHGLRANPLNTNLLLNAGQVYQDLGLVNQTSRVAEEAFRLNPALIEASILRGRCSLYLLYWYKITSTDACACGSVAYARGELQEAIEHYRAAHTIDPHAQQPLLNLANTLGAQITSLAGTKVQILTQKALLGDLYRGKEARVANQNAEARSEMHQLHQALCLLALLVQKYKY